jgi:hypothetical protein
MDEGSLVLLADFKADESDEVAWAGSPGSREGGGFYMFGRGSLSASIDSVAKTLYVPSS